MSGEHIIAIENRGESRWSAKITDKATAFLSEMCEISPKIKLHLQGLAGIYVIDASPIIKDASAFYDRHKNSITLISSKISNLAFSFYCLLHELGHHVIEMRQGISKNYDARGENISYYREEIKADSYACEMVKRYLNKKQSLFKRFLSCAPYLKSILQYRQKWIREMHKKIQKLRSVQIYKPFTWTQTISTSSTANNWYYYSGTTGYGTTWNLSIYSSGYNSTVTSVSVNIQLC